jgi:integrase
VCLYITGVKTERTWTLTRYPNLYRHKSGTYYARITSADKKTWRSLKTETLSIARARFAKLIEEEEKRKELQREHGVADERETFASAIRKYTEKQISDPSLKPATRFYYQQIEKALIKSLDKFGDLELSKVTEAPCLTWAAAFAKQASPTRFNNTIAQVKNVFAEAVKSGVRFTNPGDALKRLRPTQKNLFTRLPNKKQFRAWVATMRKAGGRFSADCADFVEFLAYSGLRKSEAQYVRWEHCDLTRGELLVVGDPETATKNGEIRRVPIIPALADLLQRMKADTELDTRPGSPVLQVREAQKAMDSAGKKHKIPRITHHDLRIYLQQLASNQAWISPLSRAG